MKICLSGPSGSGKTYSALQLARGFSDSWENICLIDTEQGSASLYSNLGTFKVINLEAPFHPKRYNEALQLSVEAGMSVVVIDSISHEWSGKVGCLEIHEQTMQRMKIPNSFAAWGSVTPLHQDFLDTITQAKVHVICTARSKTEYVLVDRNGKQTPQKVGMAPITRDGFEFEMSIHFELDQTHQAFCSKDRTGLFMDKDPFRITEDTGRRILQWCAGSGGEDVAVLIQACDTVKGLLELHGCLSEEQQRKFLPLFRHRKAELLLMNNSTQVLSKQPTSRNGYLDLR